MYEDRKPLPVIEGYTLVPAGTYEWGNDFSYHRVMTCRNHPTARYSSKNAWQRSIFISVKPVADGTPRSENGDCTCVIGDLLVMVPEEASQADGKDVIISKCAERGIKVTRGEIYGIAGDNGGYEIDGMSWDEWLDAMTMD